MTAKAAADSTRPLAENRRASFTYEVAERLQAGLQLTGPEVKAAKLGHVSLAGAYVSFRRSRTGTEAWLRGVHISPYQPAAGSQAGYVPTRDRKLLLRREEIDHLVGKAQASGLTVIPLSLYRSRSFVKVEIAVVRQRTKADRREAIRRRETSREIRSHLRS